MKEILMERKKSGFGIMHYEDDMLYEGQYKDDACDGIGKSTWPDTYYEGEYLNGTKNGYGKCITKDGYGYYGEWKLDEKDGYAKEKISNLKEIYSKYRNGKLLKQCNAN